MRPPSFLATEVILYFVDTALIIGFFFVISRRKFFMPNHAWARHMYRIFY